MKICQETDSIWGRATGDFKSQLNYYGECKLAQCGGISSGQKAMGFMDFSTSILFLIVVCLYQGVVTKLSVIRICVKFLVLVENIISLNSLGVLCSQRKVSI